MSFVTWDGNEPAPAGTVGGAVSIGNFDGVHRGHAALMAEVRRQAAHGGPAVALTFDPHPLQILRPAQFQPVLTTLTDRAELLRAMGADVVVALQTTPSLLHLTAVEFFDQVIRARLRARALVEGVNFGFGRDRQGNIDTLTDLCAQAKLGFTVVQPVLHEGRPVSSSRVRDALLAGDVREAAILLGRPYRLRGRVGTGRQRGRLLGFPTANLEAVPTLVPADGVYAVRVRRQQQNWPGAANIGPNPTFGEGMRKVEVHLIGFQGELLGQEMALDFAERLRDTRTFAGPAELTEQLRIDVERARRLVEMPERSGLHG